MLKILIVDPDPARADSLRTNLEFLEYDSHSVCPASLESMIGDKGESPADVVMMGPCSEENGLVDLFRRLRSTDPHLPVIRMASDSDATVPADVESGSTAQVSLPARFSDVQGG